MPFFSRVQTHNDIIEVIAKAQAANKEVVVDRAGRVKVEGWLGRHSRARQERANGPNWANNQRLQRNGAIAQSLKAAFARQNIHIDTLAQAHYLRDLLNAVPTKATLPGVKLFSEGVKQLLPGFQLKDVRLDRLRPDDVALNLQAGREPIQPAPIAARRGPDIPVPHFSAHALQNPDSPNVDLPPNLKKVHDNLQALNHVPRIGVHREEMGQINRYQFEVVNYNLGRQLAKTLDPARTYLYVMGLDAQNQVHLRIGYEHDLHSDTNTRLGHPSMTQDLSADAKAIIGGEIRFNHQQNCWEIDDNSGRYGFPPEGRLQSVGVVHADVLRYVAFRFAAAGFQVGNINSNFIRQTMV